MGRLTGGQAQRDRWDRAVDEEIGLEEMRAEWETHVRVSGDDPDYRYPERYRGPGASQYPPPLPLRTDVGGATNSSTGVSPPDARRRLPWLR
jgi:hypothetical protein